MKLGPVWLCAAPMLVACSDAKLSEMRPGIEGNSGLNCWLTLDFKRQPKAGDVRDVRVVFSSIVLEEDAVFDWEYIAANDYLVKTEPDGFGQPMEKFVIDPSSTPEMDPQLGPLKVKFVMKSKESITATSYADVVLDAVFYWAGKKQDSAGRGLFLVYQKK